MSHKLNEHYYRLYHSTQAGNVACGPDTGNAGDTGLANGLCRRYIGMKEEWRNGTLASRTVVESLLQVFAIQVGDMHVVVALCRGQLVGCGIH